MLKRFGTSSSTLVRSRFLVALLASLLAMTSGTARAAVDWSNSFSSEPLNSYLKGSRLRVIVVKAGDHSSMLKRAASQLLAGLRGCEAVSVAMDDSAVGAVGKLDDRSIVDKTSALPVDQVAILRIYPGADQTRSSAVVTIYDRSSRKSLAAFTVEAGSTLSPRDGSSANAGSGVSAETSDVVKNVLKTNTNASKNAVDQYEKKKIWFADAHLVNTQTGRLVRSWAIPFRGKYKEPLAAADFYEEVGRADLASSYRKKRWLKIGLGLAGYGAILGGSIYGLAGSLSCDNEDEYGSCAEHDFTPLWIGLGISGGGALLAIIAHAINPHPISAPEARALADAHNRRLKKDLGLNEDTADEPNDTTKDKKVTKASIDVRFAPYASPNGGGIAVGGRF